MYYANKRQRFLMNQGYSYKVINKLADLETEVLHYKTKEEQQQLLQLVLAANETDADEEELPNNLKPVASVSQISRKTTTMSSLSGGDEGVYMEIQRKQMTKSEKEKFRTPLFRRFMIGKKK